MEKTIERPGARVVYTLTGEGPPVLLGHSLFFTRAMWDGVLPHLDGHTFVNIELRGHGASTATAPFDVSDLADDWLAIMDAEGFETAILMGLSTGGMTAMRLVLKAPERVQGLVLMDTSADAEPFFEHLQHVILSWVWTHLGILPTGPLLKAMFSPEVVRSRPDLTQPLIDLVRSFDRSMVKHALKAIFGRDSVDLSGVEVPTLVVVGEHDAATPVPYAKHIHGMIRNSGLHIVPGAGHATAVEQPELVADLIRPFLEQCRPGRD